MRDSRVGNKKNQQQRKMSHFVKSVENSGILFNNNDEDNDMWCSKCISQ